MNHNISEIKDLNSLSNRDSRSNYSIVSEDLGQQLLQLILEYQPNPQDQYLLELSKQKTVIEIDEKFKNSHINQTYKFPKKVTDRDRNKARELQQILANSAQNGKDINKQFQSKETTKKICQNKGVEQENVKNECIEEKQTLDFSHNANDSDDSFSSLNDVSFYELNSQNIKQIKKIQHPALQQPTNQIQNSATYQMSKGNQSQVQRNDIMGNQYEQTKQIKHCYYTAQNNQNIQNKAQFIKPPATYQPQQTVKNQSYTNSNQLNKTGIPLGTYDSELINIEINATDKSNKNSNINISKEEIGLVSQQKQQNNKFKQELKNKNQASNSSQFKKNIQISNESDYHEFVSTTSNQLLDKQYIDQQIQRRPLTDKSSNAKNVCQIDFMNLATQEQASSTGTTTATGEQGTSNKHKVSNNNSNKSDFNIKHTKMAFTRIEGVFTEADEIDEDTLHKTKEEWVQQMINQNVKSDQSKQQKIGWLYTEGDVQNKSPQKQNYNIPTQQINAKVRKLKIASFHQGQKDQNVKLIQSLSLHNQFDQISNMPNTNNHILPQATTNNQFNFQSKPQNQNLEKTNFSNQAKMGALNTNFLYDVNEIQINSHIISSTSKSNKQDILGNTFNSSQQYQDANKFIKYPACVQNNLNSTNSNSFKQQNYLSENKLAKVIQSQNFNQNQQNYLAYNSINNSNVSNLGQTSKVVNMSLDYQTQDTRFTPLRSNKIPQQVNRIQQNLNSINHLNNYVQSGDEKNRSFNNISNLEYSISKSTKNKNNNISLSVTKPSVQKDESFQQEAIKTSSQFNQIHKRNQASIRKLRPKLNCDGFSSDLSDLIPTSSKEQNFTQIDLSPYTQLSKHMRNNTLNNYHLKPPTTKNSHQRQPSDNALRSSATNRVASEQSQEKIKNGNISSSSNGVDVSSSGNKILLTDSANSNIRFPQTQNNQKLKRTLKIQSCKYSSQKNQLLQEQFRNSNQYQNNIPNSTKNTSQIQNLISNNDDDLSLNKTSLKLDQQKLQMQRKEIQSNPENKGRFSSNQQQNIQLNQQKQITNNKAYMSKDKSSKEQNMQNYEKRYLKTDGDEHNDDIILFQNSKELDKNNNQGLATTLHKNYSANSEFNLNEFSGKKIIKQNLNISNFKEDKLQQNSKSKSEENRINLKSNQVQAINPNSNNELAKKKYFQKTNSIGKSLTSTQPLTLESYSTDNPNSNQQSEIYSINSNSNNKNANKPQKQESNSQMKIKISQGVNNNNNGLNSNAEKGDEVSKTQAPAQIHQKISSNIKKVIQNPNQENSKTEEYEEKQKSQIQINKKPDQLNQILVQHMQKEVKQQNININQNGMRTLKKAVQNGQQNQKSLNQNVSYTQETQTQEIQNRKFVACSLHEDSLKSYQIDPISKQSLNQVDNFNQIQKLEYLKNSAVSTASTQIGSVQQKSINKTVAYDSIQVKQTNNIPGLRQKIVQTPQSLQVNPDQQAGGVNSLNHVELGSVYLGSHATACSTQSNQSKNKSPMKQNLVSPNNFQNSNYPVIPQYSSSTRNQNTVSLFKKKQNLLYQSVSYQSQNQTNLQTQI